MASPRAAETPAGRAAKAVEEAAGAGLAVILAIILVVVFVVAVGLRLVRAIIGDVLRTLGPATECGMRIEAKKRSFRAQGMPRCAAYVEAMNEAAAAPRTSCPAVPGLPPAAFPPYASYLRTIGCAPPRAGS